MIRMGDTRGISEKPNYILGITLFQRKLNDYTWYCTVGINNVAAFADWEDEQTLQVPCGRVSRDTGAGCH